MKGRPTTRGLAWRFALFVAAMMLLTAGIVQAIQRPIAGDTNSFTALFADSSGLKTGDDVRMFGVAVGKVKSIALDGKRARVGFTVHRDRPVYRSSILSIRYQNLAGQRYIEVRQPDSPGERLAAGATVGLDHTTGSFDITSLFNGMEPVLKEFSPEAVNQLAVNALAVLQGDGTRIGATLDAIGTLSGFATDRQAVISVLLRNFKQIADQIGGTSPEAGILIQGISDVFVNLQKQFDGLMDMVDVAPSIFTPINNLLATLGFTYPANPDLDNDLQRLFPDPDAAIDTLSRLPGLLQSLIALMPAGNTGVDLTCSRGRAEVPAVVDVLIRGQRIAVCKG
ncbi:MCE family protein [Nocardia uniformis]|uniref:MCE family protein n=2 Tax=Nocardia uniformis TaxID=53432 RepID=A0A849C541_9NOCA|nr:MlaD family protein [Nocardia uniformis]NNH72776.1 MCE family protein [Nocardia uniformis]